jgi:hypothetical protein
LTSFLLLGLEGIRGYNFRFFLLNFRFDIFQNFLLIIHDTRLKFLNPIFRIPLNCPDLVPNCLSFGFEILLFENVYIFEFIKCLFSFAKLLGLEARDLLEPRIV